MILNSLKNYLKCLAYILIPLGCLFLGVLFGANLAIETIGKEIVYIKDEVYKIIPVAVEDVDELWGYVISSARELNWYDSWLGAIKMLLSEGWLAGKISTFLGLTAEQSAELLTNIQVILQTVISELTAAIVGFVVWVLLSAIAGYFITNLFVRKATVKRGLWKLILSSLLDSLFSATLIAFTTWIMTLWSPGSLISSVVSIVVFGFVSLVEAYIVHGKGKVPFKRIVNVKNFFLLYLSQMIIFVITVVAVILVVVVSNWLVGLAVGYSIVIIALLVVNVNAESYVVEQIRLKSEREREERQGHESSRQEKQKREQQAQQTEQKQEPPAPLPPPEAQA